MRKNNIIFNAMRSLYISDEDIHKLKECLIDLSEEKETHPLDGTVWSQQASKTRQQFMEAL